MAKSVLLPVLDGEARSGFVELNPSDLTRIVREWHPKCETCSKYAEGRDYWECQDPDGLRNATPHTYCSLHPDFDKPTEG